MATIWRWTSAYDGLPDEYDGVTQYGIGFGGWTSGGGASDSVVLTGSVGLPLEDAIFNFGSGAGNDSMDIYGE